MSTHYTNQHRLEEAFFVVFLSTKILTANRITIQDCRRVLLGAAVYDLFHVNRLEFCPQRTRLEEKKALQWARSNLTEALSLHFARSSSTAQLQLSRTSVALQSIARSLLLEYLTMTTTARLTSPREFTILLTKPIFAQITDFHGTKYIAVLANNKNEIPGNAIHLFQPLEGQTANIVYVAASHLGVVQLVVTDSTTWLEVGEVPDIWWFTIDVPCGDCMLLAHQDGIKIRKLSAPEWYVACMETQLQEQSDHGTAFPVPIHPRELRWFQPANRPGRMVSLKMNQPGMVVGITTFWVIILARAHIHVLEKGRRGPESRGPNTVSLSSPFEDGEKVSEVWVGITQNVVGGLGVRTNKGREIYHAHATRLHETSWALADHPQGSEKTMYYGSDAPVGVGALAFRSPPPSRPLSQFDPLATMPPIPSFRYCVEDFFGGSVGLEGVVEVTFCRLEHKPEIISGMLFRFAGGRREVLGEVRLSGQQKPMLLGGEGREVMYLEFG
ncbi:hypothetical protein FGADI_4606 [Fusarium gaditjirri]|uniref:Uncharacterized protein n=1 Tax=Fusarium gaditjirri TaxID=282569 RepID=A0A8H4TCL7_9HYPO|nr:hypothetical protein FGADI_4606 [Fusarium gaditjirri]